MPVPGATALLTNGTSTPEETGPIHGIINDISIFEKGNRGKDGLCIVAAVSKEHRLGKWKKVQKGWNSAVLIEVTQSILATLNPTS